MGGIKRVFWDIETSPNVVYTWRAGYKINISHDNILHERAIICICYKYEGDDTVQSIRWDNGDDKFVVKEFAKVIEDCDELVAHNGDRFDMKWFNGRNLMHGLPPVPPTKTVDTLKIAKKHFYLNSNRLDYLGQILLGEGKIDVPFSLWKRVMDGENSAMNEMITYCKKDVDILERVWKRLRDYDTPKTHVGVLNGLGRWSCPHCGSDTVHLQKTRPTSKGIIQRQMQCNECGRYYSIADNVYRDYLVAKNPQAST